MEQLYYEKVNKALDNLTLRADKVSKFIGFSESPGTLQKDKGRLYIDFEDGVGNYKALPFSLSALEIVFEGEGSTFKELVEAVKVKYEKRALYYYPKEEETESDKMYKDIISGVKKESIKERLERDLLDLHFSKENGGESFNKDIEEVNKRFKGRSFEHTKQKGERATFKGLVKGDKQYLVTLEDGEVVCRTTIEGFLDIYDVCKADRDFLIKRSKFTESVPITPNIKEKPTISKESEEFLDGDSFQILKYLFLNQTLTSIGGAKGKVTNITKGERDYRIWIEEVGQGESVSHPLKSVRNQFELTNVQEVTLNKIIGRMDVMKEAVETATIEEVCSPPTANGVETFTDIYKGKDNSGQVITATPVSSPMYEQMDERYIIKHYPIDYKKYFKEVDLSKQSLRLPDSIYDSYNRRILLLT